MDLKLFKEALNAIVIAATMSTQPIAVQAQKNTQEKILNQKKKKGEDE